MNYKYAYVSVNVRAGLTVIDVCVE
jgi:hypothetical protein